MGKALLIPACQLDHVAMSSNLAHGLNAPDPYEYRAIWGISVKSRRSFDLLVARQLIWIPYANPAIRHMLFTADQQPICLVCAEIVLTGNPTVVCVAFLADPELRAQLRRDPAAFAGRPPHSHEAWWLLHGDCFDHLSRERMGELDQRIELALRSDTVIN